MKIPRDIHHIPLLNEDLSKNEECLLWQIPGQLKRHLELFYPECYNYLCERNLASSAESHTQTLGVRRVAFDAKENTTQI